ncbi:MAG: hypothetical protein LBT97_01245 [Planctomycetota bacterium]|jgi:hypothetical protein|nr:hypothetical protein [Planctomycetota bacterium]
MKAKFARAILAAIAVCVLTFTPVRAVSAEAGCVISQVPLLQLPVKLTCPGCETEFATAENTVASKYFGFLPTWWPTAMRLIAVCPNCGKFTPVWPVFTFAIP